MKIQDVSRMLGMSTRSIRYYEERGLLAVIPKEHNGYRMFRMEDVERLRLIGWLRELGLSIDEIRSCIDEALAGDMTGIRVHMMRRRKAFVEEIVQMKLLIQQMDQLIHTPEETEGTLLLMKLEQAAEQAKRVEQVRSSWEDKWNFDRLAEQYDKKVKDVADKHSDKHGHDHTHDHSHSHSHGHSHDHSRMHADYMKALQRTSELADIRPGDRGLDLGIGTGNLSAQCMDKGASMTGIDQSEQMLSRCREKWPSIRLLLGNMMALPVVNETFDFVVSSFALHHLTDEQQQIALQEIDQVVLPGSRVVIADQMFADEAHRISYMDKLKQAGREEQIERMKHIYYADQSKLLAWLRSNGYEAGVEQWNELTHIVYATKQE